MARIVRGEVGIDRAEVSSSRTESVDTLVDVAKTIWREVRASGVAPGDDAGNEALYERLRKAHPDFAKSFPVPFRWMVQAREFSARAFRTHLKTNIKSLYRDRDEFLGAQADYLVLVYRRRNPRAPPKQVSQYRETVMKALADDNQSFMDARAEAEAEVKRLDAAVDAERRRRLVAHLRQLKSAETC
jgi:hypothetical protein